MKIKLPRPVAQPILALGGDLKCRPVFAAGDEAEVLDDIGDLASPETQDALEATLDARAPRVIACDRHPGYFSTSLAERAAAERGCRLAQVQHHRAHVAAVCLERGLFDETVVGLAFDGTGYGDDGTAWGGEIFVGSLARGFARRAHFAPLPLPGGDAAVRGVWRIALALLLERGAGETELADWIASRGAPVGDLRLFRAGVQANIGVGRSTALGRWFDAIAALLGVRATAEFEAQAAIETQKLAEANVYDAGPRDFPWTIRDGEPLVIDFPALLEIARRPPSDAPRLAYAFHVAAAEAVAEAAQRLAAAAGARQVLAAGGVFFNRLFDRRLAAAVEARGLAYVKPQALPPGDQAIALGQIGLVLAADHV